MDNQSDRLMTKSYLHLMEVRMLASILIKFTFILIMPFIITLTFTFIITFIIPFTITVTYSIPFTITFTFITTFTITFIRTIVSIIQLKITKLPASRFSKPAAKET